jgi:hypothetical protein
MQKLLPLLLLAAACGPKAVPATETLPRLRAAIDGTVTTPEQNKANSELVQQVSDEGHLLGLTRDELAERIGKGDECSNHPLCDEQGFDPSDWYYEVGHPGEGYMRVRPALIVGFDRFGKSVRTYNLRVE